MKAVNSFLRNFDKERTKLQDILEMVICYGIHCLSRNFQLKGITTAELRSITSRVINYCGCPFTHLLYAEYDTIKNTDFFVRNASRPSVPLRQSDPEQVRTKPSRLWRDGDEIDSRALLSAVSVNGEHRTPSDSKPIVEDVYFLPSDAQRGMNATHGDHIGY